MSAGVEAALADLRRAIKATATKCEQGNHPTATFDVDRDDYGSGDPELADEIALDMAMRWDS